MVRINENILKCFVNCKVPNTFSLLLFHQVPIESSIGFHMDIGRECIIKYLLFKLLFSSNLILTKRLKRQ